MRIRDVTWLLLWLLALPCMAAQPSDLLRRNIQFQQLSTADGLPHQMVYDVEQDGSGYLWIATQEGLGRYDGYEVRNYFHLRTDAQTLSSDFVRVLHRDSRDRLWIGTEAGVDLQDAEGDVFQRDPFAAIGATEALSRSIRAIAEGPGGMLWFGTGDGGLVAVDETAGVVSVIDTETAPGLPVNEISSLLTAADGSLWIGTGGGGVLRLDPGTGAIEVPASLTALNEATVRALLQDRDGRIWIGTDARGVVRIDPVSGLTMTLRAEEGRPGALPNDRVRAIHEDPTGTLWFATDAGLAEWRPGAEGFVTYSHRTADARSLPSDRVNTLFSDASGVLWAGTWNGGSRWNRVSDVFTYFDAAEGQLPGDFVASVDEDSQGVLWIGTYGEGLGRFDPVTGETRFYRHDDEDPASLPDDRVMFVHVDRSDRVWIATRAAGLALLDAEQDRFVGFRNDPSDPASISGDAITSILQDSRGDLWVGTFGTGLNRLPGASGDRFQRLRTGNGSDEGSLGGDRVLTLAEGPGGAIWIGMEGSGLDRLDAETGEIDHFRQFGLRDGETSVFELDSVTDLRFAADGSLWIGTLGQGLLQWREADRSRNAVQARIFDKSSGLPADAVYGILEADDGAVWVSSNRGLTRLDPETGASRLFDSQNGLRDSEFNAARVRAGSGELLFGGPSGLVRFLPDELPFNARPPRIVATASSRSERLATARSGADAPSVRVGYLDPFLAFDFVALDFVSPDKNQYRYRLAGFDPDWVYAEGFRRAVYTNIPAGRYAFEVQASNNDGVWNEEVAQIAVVAVPAPWKSLWAYGLYVLIAMSLAGLYLRAQREKLARESRQRVLLEEQVELRTRELAQSNQNLQRLNERLEEASVTDSLTGLRNRRYADKFLSSEISKFERDQLHQVDAAGEQDTSAAARSMFLMMLDLDGFKDINDRFGHHAGDRALLQVRDLLLNTCRASDTIIRWGGDEFLISGTTSDYADVKVLAERLRDAIASHIFDVGSGKHARLSASIGITPYPLVPDRYSFCSWELVSAVADQAAYIAKMSRRDAWVSLVGTDTLSPEMLTSISNRIAALVEEGKLELETNVEGELRMAGGARIDPAPAS